MNPDFQIIAAILIQFLVGIAVFTILYSVAKFTLNKLKENSDLKTVKLFNPKEYFPDEQISELKQIFYLLMILIFVLNILYLLFYWKGTSQTFLVLDVIISVFLALNLKINTRKDLLILFLLIPFASISLLVYNSVIFSLDLFHSLVFFYYIKVYYDKFMEYTSTNSLGITIMLLFFIVFVSFLFTIFVEGVTPLDSLVMVSNAFTSNGYAILGESSVGKINELFLVWSGFILSGVGTATLTLAIMKRRIDDDFNRLEEKVKKNKKN